MSKLENRLVALENRKGGALQKVHLVIRGVGQTEEEAREEYGAEKIGPEDMVILIKMVEPIWENGIVGGKMLPQPKNN